MAPKSEVRGMTTMALSKLAPGRWLSDATPGHGGKLLARRLSGGGTMFYFRYAITAGKRDTIPLGVFSRDGSKGLSLVEARARAADLRAQHRSGVHDLRRTLERDHVAAVDAAAKADPGRTLGALLTAYCDGLDRAGKASAKGVRRELYCNVRSAWPKLWAAPIDEVTADDLLDVTAALADAGHKRQAEKTRAYLRAAYTAGMKARRSADALPALRDLRISSNPARDLTPVEGGNTPHTRALSLHELRAYWHRIQNPECAALRFHLLTGCQRAPMLARATIGDYDADTHTLLLLDPKGRRKQPRPHLVPVLPAACDAMDAMHGGTLGPYVFTSTGGRSALGFHQLWTRVTTIALAMFEAGELPGGTFTPGDLRRTVETRLAAAGVSKDHRAQLQSHGLGGVQDKNYDRYEYLPEKRAALETLHSLLTE